MTNAHVYCTFEHEQMIVPACTVVLLIPTLEKKGHLSCCSWYRISPNGGFFQQRDPVS